MGKLERIKAIIDLYKTLLPVLLVALFGMIAFLFVNSDNLSNFKLAVIIVGIVLNCVAMSAMIWHYIINLNRMEDL